MFNIFRTSLDKQVENELYICERMLLEAEGALEQAEANVSMLRARRTRLQQALAGLVGR